MTAQILLVDDDPAHRIFAVRGINLFSKEIQIQQCSSATEAIEKIKDNIVYDLIIVDLKLDHENGLDVVKFVRQTNVYTPIVVISTSDLPIHISESYQLGANCFISKGTDPVAFSQILCKCVKFYLG